MNKSNFSPEDIYIIDLIIILAKYYIDKMKWLERLSSSHAFKVTDLKSYINNGLDLYGAFLDTQSALTGFQVPFIHTQSYWWW